MNGKRIKSFLLYSASGKFYIERLADNEREFVAGSLEREVRLPVANLITALTLTFKSNSD